MFLARNTKKKRFERPKQLDPQKAENQENRLKKKGLLNTTLALFIL